MIYIQADTEKTMPHHFDAACAMYGAIDLGERYRLTTIEEVTSGRFNALLRKHLFVGSTHFMTQVFAQAGAAPRLPRNSDRAEEITSLHNVTQRLAAGGSLFVKPLQPKLFGGGVYDAAGIATLHHHAPGTEVIVSAVFGRPIVSEWRCYVLKGSIVDARHYSGDFRTAPDWDFAAGTVAANADMPVAYAMDLGILDDGTNVVIEYNDMWAIGNYGMENALYVNMLRERYTEVMALQESR